MKTDSAIETAKQRIAESNASIAKAKRTLQIGEILLANLRITVETRETALQSVKDQLNKN